MTMLTLYNVCMRAAPGGRWTLEKEREERATFEPSEADATYAKEHSSFYHMVHELLNPGFAAQDVLHR